MSSKYMRQLMETADLKEQATLPAPVTVYVVHVNKRTEAGEIPNWKAGQYLGPNHGPVTGLENAKLFASLEEANYQANRLRRHVRAGWRDIVTDKEAFSVFEVKMAPMQEIPASP
jgi:hypothetical protein